METEGVLLTLELLASIRCLAPDRGVKLPVTVLITPAMDMKAGKFSEA